MPDAPVIMDLSDFTPEEYELRFSIAGHAYVVRYGEATVDEVFRMLADAPEGDVIERRRRVVTRFFQQHLTQGDPEQLQQDMELLPYSRPGAPFDVATFYEGFMARVKKKDPTAGPRTTSGPRG